jgi:hypothetical protein
VSIIHVERRANSKLTYIAAWFILPVRKDYVEKALRETIAASALGPKLQLQDTPTELNIPTGYHPVIVSAGSLNDVRQGGLQLATSMMSANSLIPHVSINNSKTPFTVPIINYIAGVDQETNGYVAGLIPAVVGKQSSNHHSQIQLTYHCEAYIGGLAFRVGLFQPLNAPLQEYSDGSKGINSKWAQAPSLPSGPTLINEAIDLKFIDEPNQATPKYSIGYWEKLLSFPYVQGSAGNLITPLCVRNTFFFTNSTAQPTYRTGNVTLGPSAGLNTATAYLQKGSPDGSGFYQGVYGFSACGQVVGYGAVVPLGEECEDAAKAVQNTPRAL